MSSSSRAGDPIGSTMLTTDDAGAPVQEITHTAFGEPVVWTGSARQVGGPLPEGFAGYAYAGQFGYESDLLTLEGANPALPAVTVAHVGWRWYQPGVGRFVRRDSVGILAGLKPYAYASNNALVGVDPSGQCFVAGAVTGGIVGGIIGGMIGAWQGGLKGAVTGAVGGAVTGAPIGLGLGPIAAGAAGGAVAGALGGLMGAYSGGYACRKVQRMSWYV